MPQVLNYTAVKDGNAPWKRLVILKDRFTRRLLKPTEARAYIQTGEFTKMPISATITTENGIMLEISAVQLNDIPTGERKFDIWATIGGYERVVAEGTINVSAPDFVTPREDIDYMEIRFSERSDFRQSYAWKDSNGTVITLAGAFLQAKNSSGTTVLDLRWYNTPPTENTIASLPANQRGYLAPITGGTLTVHVSDKNSVSAGEYPYDLFVITTDGDQRKLFSGVVVVEASISVNPA